jgi:hypothetical protein
MARVADHVYDHILAVCRDASAARAGALDALSRSPRSVAVALGHARTVAVDAARQIGDASRPPGDTVPDGLLELAWLLAATRPAAERALVDLGVRHGLDRAGLSRALGSTPARAAAEVDAVVERWEHDLRPALLAFLGPGECDGLRSALGVAPEPAPDDDAGGESEPAAAPAQPPDPTLDALLAVAPAVADHVERCDACRDRVRAMASVRSLLAQVPVAFAPPSLQPTGGRRRSLPRDGETPPPTHRRRRTLLVSATVVVVLLGAAAAALAALGDGDDRVAVLTRVPARNALAAVPDEVAPGQVFLLESTVDRTVRWRVRAGQPWLLAEPASGVLEPRRTTDVEVLLGDGAPEGDVRVDLTVTGHDGSAVLVRVRGTVEHPPTVAAAAEGCTVTAQVEDESEVASVELRWRAPDGVDGSRPMRAVNGGYRADVAAAGAPARWWVTAVDGRGNRARSPEEPVTGC